MSGLSMRARFTTVAVSAAIVAPFALMGGSAEAVEAPSSATSALRSTACSAASSAAPAAACSAAPSPLSTVTGAASNPLAAADIVTGTLGGVLGNGALDGVTSLADLEGVLGTVTGLLDVDGLLKTVTDPVGTVINTLNLDKLLALPVKLLSPAKQEVAGASTTKNTKAKKATETVEAGALPHTGGNADLTAMLLCAGLAVAGTGVTLVTRRRGSILGAA